MVTAFMLSCPRMVVVRVEDAAPLKSRIPTKRRAKEGPSIEKVRLLKELSKSQEVSLLPPKGNDAGDRTITLNETFRGISRLFM
jgi:hypothetical protein